MVPVAVPTTMRAFTAFEARKVNVSSPSFSPPSTSARPRFRLADPRLFPIHPLFHLHHGQRGEDAVAGI